MSQHFIRFGRESGLPGRVKRAIARKMASRESLEAIGKVFLGCKSLKGKFGRDLQASRCAATEEGIANADVAGHCQRIEALGPAIQANTVDIRSRQEAGVERAGKVGMIEQIVGLEAKLEMQAFGQVSIFIDRKIELAEIRTQERVTALVPKVHGVPGRRTEHTILSCSAQAIEGARHGERAEIEKIVRVAIVVFDGSNNIRLRKKGSTAIEVVRRVNQMEGLA